MSEQTQVWPIVGRARGAARVPVVVPDVPRDGPAMLAWLVQAQQVAGPAVSVQVHLSLRQVLVTVVDEGTYRGWCTALRCPLGSRRVDELGEAMSMTAAAGGWLVTVTCHLSPGRAAA